MLIFDKTSIYWRQGCGTEAQGRLDWALSKNIILNLRVLETIMLSYFA